MQTSTEEDQNFCLNNPLVLPAKYGYSLDNAAETSNVSSARLKSSSRLSLAESHLTVMHSNLTPNPWGLNLI